MRSAAGVFERPTLLVRPMSTSTFVFWFSSHKVYQPVCLQTRSSLLLYIPVCLLIGRDYDANGAWYLHERWDWQAPPSYRGRLRGDVEFGLHRRESWHARGRYPDAHGLEVPARCGAASGRHPPAPTAMARPEGDSCAGRCGVTRPGRIPDGCGRGGEFGVTAGTTALIAALQPLLAAALAGPVLGEHVGRQQWAGLAVGLV